VSGGAGVSAMSEVMKISIHMSCDHKCEWCEMFFECDDPSKWDMYKRRRMAEAIRTMAKIRHKVAVIGGKGGTGKSTVSVNLATALAMMGKKVCVLDQDLDGSSIPKLFGKEGERMKMTDKGLEPVEAILGIKLVSLGFIEKGFVTLFHELRRAVTEEFLAHVNYGEADYLVVDLPPGTSSDAANLMQYIPDLDGVIVVTVGPRVSQMAARRAALMAMKAGVEVLGVIENMSGYICGNCGKYFELMTTGGGKELADELGVPFLGRIPLHPDISKVSDQGVPFVYALPDNPASKAIMSIARELDRVLEEKKRGG